MVRVAVKRVRVISSRGRTKSLSGSELANQLKSFYSDYLIEAAVPDTREIVEKQFPKIEWRAYKPLPKPEEYKAPKEKPKAIYTGFSNHDCEAHYRCPLCGCSFGSYQREKNENGEYCCPECKEELSGLG